MSPISRPKFKVEIEFKNVSYTFEGSTQPVLAVHIQEFQRSCRGRQNGL